MKKFLTSLVTTSLVAFAAAAAMVSGRGPLDDVNSDENTIEIRRTTFRVDSRSVLLGADGKPTTLLKLEDAQGGHVWFKSRPGSPHRIVDHLQLVDEDADEVE